MTKVTTLITTFIVGLLVTVGAVCSAPKAQAAVNVAVPFTVPSGAIWNVPKGAGGKAADRWRWHNTVRDMINATPPGATITIAIYSWAHEGTAKALLAADARGVIIRLIMFDIRLNSITDKFAKALNDGKPSGSYFRVCKGACLGATSGPRSPGLHHAKVLSFSQVLTPAGPVNHVSTVGTGNLSLTNGESSGNVWQVIRSDKTLYDGLVAYVGRMKADRDRRTATATIITSGKNRFYLYPQMNKNPDVVLDTLKATTCAAKRGFGNSKGKTVVRIAIYNWSYARIPIARRVAVLKKAGCDVGVIVNDANGLLDPRVRSTLMNAEVRVLNAYKVGVMHTHAKTVTISGTVDGAGTNRILTGSANFTRGSIYANDDVLHRIIGKGSTMQYLALWDTWATWATKMRAVRAMSGYDPQLREE
jgi:hypothetical protein